MLLQTLMGKWRICPQIGFSLIPPGVESISSSLFPAILLLPYQRRLRQHQCGARSGWWDSGSLHGLIPLLSWVSWERAELISQTRTDICSPWCLGTLSSSPSSGSCFQESCQAFWLISVCIRRARRQRISATSHLNREGKSSNRKSTS